MATVNVGLVGVGNCSSSFVQGLEYYKDPAGSRPGLANPTCAGYAVGDVRVTSAFDVNAEQIDRDLAEAIWTPPNNALKFADVPRLGVPVHDGVLADGLSGACASRLRVRGQSTLDDVAAHLVDTRTDVVVSFLPTGSQQASEIYAEAALRAGCAFVNCLPAVMARSPEWASRFRDAHLPLIGDDLKSQFGATLLHHAVMDALAGNGVAVRDTYQIVVGGNMDFLNLQDPSRVASKKASKVQGFGAGTFGADRASFGAQFAPSLKDRKTAYVRVRGEAFGGTAIDVDMTMNVEDSPSAAGNVLDAVRHAKAALDRGQGGVLRDVSCALMKAPPP